MNNVHYIMYHSNHVFSSYDCLYAVWDMDKNLSFISAPYIPNYYLIPYCRRADNEELIYSIDETISTKINFTELRQKNITGEDLLNWFLPIDIIEEYEMGNESFLYNCSLPWFGTKCQYKFPYDPLLTFNDIVNQTFSQRLSSSSIKTGSCYRFIENCNDDSWPMCLDWREICDKKLDCPNGEDEKHCEELELNECNSNEYQCHNGQCIPLEFIFENPTSVDCLDGSDEKDIYTHPPAGEPLSYNYYCMNLPIFRCEERTARYPQQFVCGDGEYINAPYMPQTQPFCANKRDTELTREFFTSLKHIEDEKCREAFYYLLHYNRTLNFSITLNRILRSDDLSMRDCESLQEKCSSEWLVLPKRPNMFGFFPLIYFTNRSIEEFKQNIKPDLICFNIKNCPILKDQIIVSEIINGLTCFSASNLTIYEQISTFDHLISTSYDISQQCLTKGIEDSCNNSFQFHCHESRKCLSYHRVQDGHQDCYFNEDEDEELSACLFNDSTRFQCEIPNGICLSPVAIGNGYRECFRPEDEDIDSKQDFNKTALYSAYCLGLRAQHSYGTLDTDSYHCELWPCDTPYVHCDKIWDCPNGIDELNCPDTNCSLNQHQCYDKDLNLTYCLSIKQFVDQIHDYCIWYEYRPIYFNNGSIIDKNKYYLWNETKCLYANNICNNIMSQSSMIIDEDVCLYDEQIPQLQILSPQNITLFNTNKTLCSLELDLYRDKTKRFLTSFRFGNYPPLIASLSTVRHIRSKEKNKEIYYPMNISETWYCNRGILILFGINERKTCLCPPSYYGSQCQWQSQRISLTIQFISPRTTFISSIFQVIIMLINEQNEIIGNHEEIVFVPNRDCRIKYHVYLLYPEQPKLSSINYSIRIDLYHKETLNHWTSWFLSIPFQFLPVNRISTQLFIPKERLTKSCPLSCGLHGQCIQYTNNELKYFCQCHRDYTGPFCNISYECLCSNNSFCLSSNICICPIDRFGSKCYIKRSICSLKINPCQNGGLCIPTDDRINLQGYLCYCKEQYYGLNCEYLSSRINLKLDETIVTTSSFVFIHFITIFQYAKYERTTLLKKIPFDENTITFCISKEFHLIFIQLINESYYLAIVREEFIPSENLNGKISLEQHCPYVKQYFNSTFLEYESKYHPKYYSYICRKRRDLMCFYDETLMCICDIDRFANCFEFNHTIDGNCYGHNDCQNNGQCFQNNQTCPTMSICVCKDCYYGGKCQMSTEGNLLSLDQIIGYFIKPTNSFSNQRLIIKVTLSITLVIFLFGLIDFILSILTFHMKNSLQVGCGYYLLISSILSLFMIIILVIKFFHLIFSQMKIIENEFQLLFACKSIDMILKSLLASNEWMVACVAIERTINTISGPKFNKIKSKKLAKWIIVFVISLTFISHFHDPYYRELIKDIDGDDQRIWCFVRYPSFVYNYNYFITLFHFLVPILINIISAIIIIILVTRSRSNLQRNKSYKQHLKEQLNRHKHLLISPLTLVFLGTPRLIFSFIRGCMRTTRNPWFYMIGYYVSFIPPILTFLTFVIPSDNYRKEFRSSIQKQFIRIRSIFFSGH
ncbi:unnamed protein product [Adineta steineri]|uniref:Uncharacterized protein n=1 Tax=Adineta steineri TaxID=433720 RepID=A0A819E6N2_9BILA|nr:unnamed protein product [Adineta steineri]